MLKGLLITNIVLTSAVLVAVLFMPLGGVMIPLDTITTSSPPPNTDWIDDKGGMYEASATILAIVSLGYVLGIRFGTTTKGMRYQGVGIILVLASTIIVIVAQTLTMLNLCCVGITQDDYGKLLVTTAIALIGVVIGYAIILYVPYYDRMWKKRQERLSSKY